MSWPKTPPGERIHAMKRDGAEWRKVEYKDLRAGDVYRAVGSDGQFIHPLTHEPDDEVAARCLGDPGDSIARGYGTEIEIEVAPIDELLRRTLN